MHTDPIERIEWRDAATLNANDYNPNVVFNQELRLLELSILTSGWVQPILVTREGTIIDGFHRAMLSRESTALRERYNGDVPCVVMDLPRAEAMLLTIRINRAKGTHVALRMADIVQELIDVHGVKPQQIAQEIGATKDEVALLYQNNVFKARNLDAYRYGKAWVPHDTLNDAPAEAPTVERADDDAQDSEPESFDASGMAGNDARPAPTSDCAAPETSARFGPVGDNGRYDSEAYLAAWKERGVYPEIHDAIAAVCAAHLIAERVLDLGCSTGLLADRLRKEQNKQVLGIESDPKALALARQYGVGAEPGYVSVKFVELKVTADTVAALTEVLREHAVTALVARRVLPEMFTKSREWAPAFVQALWDGGVRELVIEGRFVTKRAKHTLASLDAELDLLRSAAPDGVRVQVVERVGQVAYVRLEPTDQGGARREDASV